jgi:hypothetical protein
MNPLKKNLKINKPINHTGQVFYEKERHRLFWKSRI